MPFVYCESELFYPRTQHTVITAKAQIHKANILLCD